MSHSSKFKQPSINFRERKHAYRNKSLSPQKQVSLKPQRITRSTSKVLDRTPLTEKHDTGNGNKQKTPRRSRRISGSDSDEFTPTPSKRKRSNEVVQVGLELTPSTALSRLCLNSTRKTTKDSEKFKPKELFPCSAQASLHSGVSDSLPCREDELNKITMLLLGHLEKETSGSIYVSGLPGTGKTACLNKIITLDQIENGYKIVNINCTTVSTSGAVYKRICQELNINTAGKTDKSLIVAIEKYLTKKHKMILLILDEIDQLATKTQLILYKIFEWPSHAFFRIVLLGIANAMDLTDRSLPRLCARVDLKPVLIHFPPYTKDQIAVILKQRLGMADADKIFAPGALELLSAKVASMSGDIRRALDLGRRLLELTADKWDSALTNVVAGKVLKEETTPSKQKGKENTPKKCYLGGRTSAKQLNFDVEKLKDDMTPPKKHIAIYSASPVRTSPRRLNFGMTEIQDGCTPIKSLQTPRVPLSPRKPVADDDKTVQSPQKRGSSWVPQSPLRRSPRKQSCVESKDVLMVMKNLYGPAKSFRSDEESTFPLHQKLLICTFLLLLKKGKSKDVTIVKLHQVYVKICRARSISAVDQSGFIFLCRQLQSTGILHVGKGAGRLAKLSLQWSECEVTDALKDLTLLSSILDDTACLS